MQVFVKGKKLTLVREGMRDKVFESVKALSEYLMRNGEGDLTVGDFVFVGGTAK